ncbi:MAG: hypothetical protein Q8K98_03030 [Bacteroidota bacterium]|nr:hypothetical protein [Bacteroidota bacterium]
MKTHALLFLITIFLLSVQTSCKKSPTEPSEPIPQDTITVRKPNIYIYPETKISLHVSIIFPRGGSVIESIPLYENGWNIEVEPSGKINNIFDYLFYESENPDLCQYRSGWIIKKDDLTSFFTQNMLETRFIQKEIDDFIEYWIPLLNNYSSYAIYPQYALDIEKMIELKFSCKPNSVLRLFYVIKGVHDDKINIAVPNIPRFVRKGFTVTEWGVIIK